MSLMDQQFEVTCNTNIIANHVSLTACECLAIPYAKNNRTHLRVRDGSDSRYFLLGGTVTRAYPWNSHLLAKTFSFHIHPNCSRTNIFGVWKWVHNFGIIIHTHFEVDVSVRLEPLPTWSSLTDLMERRYREIVRLGYTCVIVGWSTIYYVSIILKVEIHDGLDCFKYSCAATRNGSQCSTMALTCTSNSTSNSSLGSPFCDLEPGMPLICGPTADTYAITESSSCRKEPLNYMWKISHVLDWVQSFVKMNHSELFMNLTDGEPQWYPDIDVEGGRGERCGNFIATPFAMLIIYSINIL